MILALLIPSAACWQKKSQAHGKRVIVLGVDGMDPGFVERHWSDLPNLKRLRERGGLVRLATTTPPQSPVAWSSFITGTDPAQDGIFDFVHRDPSTMQPLSSMAEVLPPAHHLIVGPYDLPLSKARVRSMRRGRTFWEILDQHGIPVTVIRIPANYPPVNKGQALAGMGTPDLQGTFGTFTYYTDDPLQHSGDVSGGRIIAVAVNNGRALLPIEGPPNTLRRDRRPENLELIVDIDPDVPVMHCRIGEQQFIVREGEWSPWVRVQFTLVRGLASVAGMFRLYARELHPGLRIYRSPLNIDPVDPALPISAPESFSRELAGRMGPFYTQGIEEDTSALREGALDLPEYLQQSGIVIREHAAMLRDALDRFRDGLLFFYFSEIDQNSHMLWGKHEHQLVGTYQAVDRDIGAVLDRAPEATIIVMSDHGFAPFDRALNLNTWLWREGFLALDDPRNAGAGEMFAHVDWRRTKAYALGLNAVYINEAGREKNGIVQPGAERDSVVSELARRLREFRDPETGRVVVDAVSCMNNTASRFAPDLIVGYARGYRASWETALGAIPPDILVDNTDAWIGDHCIAPADVPAVLIGSRKPRLSNPRLKDLTIAILNEFEVAADPAMSGQLVY
ncbi:MAG: alkaline phosphatase family protein [Acidobacteriaceae bacterium]|nr:alkaline phosphatase family protein [Acidobacteriaceae bacterium]